MLRTIPLSFSFLLVSLQLVLAQTITGNLSLLPNQPIKLEGFNGLKTYPISATTIDEKGSFKLNYSKADYVVPPTSFSNNYLSLNLI